ncbi:MAG: diguanylate cyclase [Gammaproteobacteria bacterium]|nr:diguanylate cyclase [Gammaproteobacteria bacterium]
MIKKRNSEIPKIGGAQSDVEIADSVGTDVVSVLDGIDLPILVVDVDCKVADFNRAAAEVFGVVSSDVGRRACSVQSLADAPEIEQVCIQVMADGVPSRHDLRNGDRWFLVRISPYAGADRQVSGAVLAFTNVTAFRASLGQAIYEREYTKTILNTVIDPLVVLGDGLHVHTANRAFYDWFGASREQTQGVPLSDLGDHSWKASGLWSSLHATLSHNREFHTVEFEGAFPNVGHRTVLLDARRLARDETALVLLAFRDITELKQAEKARRESEIRFRTLFESMDEGYCVVEMIFDEENNPLDYRFLEVNPVFERQTGIKDARGRLMREIAPELEQHWFDIYGRVALTGETLRFENPAAALHRYYEVCAFRVGSPELRHVGVVFNDITMRKNLEFQRERALAQEEALRKDAETATRALVQTQEVLHKRVAELAAADRHRNEFLAILAHELRNPLAPLKNAVQILRRSSGDAVVIAKARDLIDRQVHHMSRLVGDLLEAARAQNGQIKLQRSSLDLRSIIEHVVDLMRPVIEGKHQRLRVTLPEAPVWVEGDAARLEQIFTNLLSNANKFTQERGNIEISLGAGLINEERCAIVQVLDNGEGIEPELVPRLFELFAQADRSLAHSQGGLGIGLSLVRTLVEMHGGRVSMRSDGRGSGSTFEVRIPLTRTPVDQETSNALLPPLQSVAGQRRVLVVEDNHDIRESSCDLLSMAGFEVKGVSTGSEALEMAPAFAPNVVLLDVGLPGLSGYDVARRLRDLPQFVSTVLIAITGYDTAEARALSAAAGFDHHICKPVNFDELATLLS